MPHNNDDAIAFLKKLLDSSTKQGQGKMGIRSDIVDTLVREDPESAANVVLAVCRKDDVPSAFAQLAMAIAVAYKTALNDDSLVNEVNHAPWVNRISAPTVLADEQEAPAPKEEHPLLEVDSTSFRILEVDKDDLQSGSVKNFVRILGVDEKSPELIAQLPELWGMCILVFPLDKDPRGVWDIPEARRFIANLHEAMPYFPAYLHFRQEFGMFMVYFGCLADPDALTGGNLDLNHRSVTRRLSESLTAVGLLALNLGKDPRPVWRTMLSPLPVALADELVDTFYKRLFRRSGD
jgi:hypothetical protein